MAELEKRVNMLMKAVEERDFEIASLKNHIESRDAAESSHTHTIKNVDKGKAIMQENLLVKQFVRTFKGNTFDWYIDLKPESIDSWEQLERNFLNRFYNTRCIRIKPRTFEELATRAHDMELSIANRGNNDLLVPEIKKEKKEVKSTQKVSKGATKEIMVVSTTPLTFVSKEKKVEKCQDEGEKRRPTLKERQEKVYSFPDPDLPNMLKQLLEKKLIQLPKCK
ncbi:ty3-gypsy retrotransposon protein [Cucumis melo var. makuwa]|uniref:Ty3-gypsy retrotransposon protein n=1 Tax=Cucumis melo var. makuwa TaxID=1194695 RepID=A0A5D3BU27_CUCMM|nr:ty3-gypsy retrotransposon protein [Cucumis melo var. makuwa]TYK02605.1 ty3-gypsy retrotransposon protein [Cucumis melo var. makuwa]